MYKYTIKQLEVISTQIEPDKNTPCSVNVTSRTTSLVKNKHRLFSDTITLWLFTLSSIRNIYVHFFAINFAI